MNLVLRQPNYVNPYARTRADQPKANPTKKPRKKMAKGPSLSGRRLEL